MPYNRKQKDLDAGPIGHLRLANRQIQEARSAVQVPSATGGAPRQTAGDQVAGAVGEQTRDRMMEQNQRMAQNYGAIPHSSAPAQIREPIFNQPLETPDVLAGLNSRAQQEFDRWIRADPDLVQSTLEYVREVGIEFDDMDAEEIAERMFTSIRGLMEPQPEARPLGEIVRPSLTSRRLLNQLRRWRTARSTFALPPIERNE